MLLLREPDVRRLLSADALIPLMANALKAFSAGQVLQPVRVALIVPPHEGFLGLMPAYMRSTGALAAKLVSFFPQNAAKSLPTHLAVILLWDSATGEVLALMDGRLITEMRTAATSAAATQVLARPQARVLAILGSGVQARSHLEAMQQVRSIAEARVWSRTAANVRRFVDEVRPHAAFAVRACPSAEEAVRDADLIVTATSATMPVLRGAWVAPGAHINAVGAPRPNWRELDTDAIRRARVFVDSRAGALAESGDLLVPIEEGAISADHIRGEIGEVLAGAVLGRTDSQEVTVFKSLGMAVEDVVTAQFVYAHARERNIGQEIAW